MPKASRNIVVSNSLGLHARPAMQFVDAAGGFESDVTVTKPPGQEGDDDGSPEPTVADGKSVMQMITLAATEGTRLTIAADGPDAEAAVAELAGLFDGKFGED